MIAATPSAHDSCAVTSKRAFAVLAAFAVKYC